MEYRQRNSFYPNHTVKNLSKHAKTHLSDDFADNLLLESNDIIKMSDKKMGKSKRPTKFDCK